MMSIVSARLCIIALAAIWTCSIFIYLPAPLNNDASNGNTRTVLAVNRQTVIGSVDVAALPGHPDEVDGDAFHCLQEVLAHVQYQARYSAAQLKLLNQHLVSPNRRCSGSTQVATVGGIAQALRSSKNTALQEREARPSLSIVTYNLWGHQDEWEARVEALCAELVKLGESGPDVIALQEVRVIDGVVQSDILQQCLNTRTGRRYSSHFFTAHKMKEQQQDVIEGLSVLSRVQVEGIDSVRLPSLSSSNDLNGRIAVIADVCLVPPCHNDASLVRIVHVHLSYEDMQQCVEAAGVARLLHERDPHGTVPVIMLGDTNTYFDFEYPIRSMSTAPECFRALQHIPWNPCADAFKDVPTGNVNTFRDVWKEIYMTDGLLDKIAPMSFCTESDAVVSGFTFPTHLLQLPPNQKFDARWFGIDQSRPDRILVRDGTSASWSIDNVFYFLRNPMENGQFVSDHLGVWAALSLSRPT